MLPLISSQTLARLMLKAVTAASMDVVVMEEAMAVEVAKGKVEEVQEVEEEEEEVVEEVWPSKPSACAYIHRS